MQAQNTAKREKPKKHGQHAAPPARSKAGGLGIPKKSVDFLLDHAPTSLRSSIHASHGKDAAMTLSM